MKDGRKSTKFQSKRDKSADVGQGLTGIQAKASNFSEEILTSPAFDRWLERQVQTLFAACEEPADPKLIDLIRKAFPPEAGKVTE